jgi:V/A-type H+/Na+-transporting ATPase subunit D
MARLTLSKSSLSRERKRLATFERFLPSLDLKRRQLMRARAEAAAVLQRLEAQLAEILHAIGDAVPMLANREVELTGLAYVRALEEDAENVVGVSLPRLARCDVGIRDYARLGRPQWVDVAAVRLQASTELTIRVDVARRRLDILKHAVTRITQRVNLFEKVLIPRTRGNIHRIQVYLGDAERAAVVRSKVAKKKHGHTMAVA